MGYRYGNRFEIEMFPQSIEDYVAQDDTVRAYDTFVETINPKAVGLNINPNKEGCPEYNPIAMIKLLLYGYSYGIRSSRKLERACYHNISFIWLMGGLKPDHKTISEFRRNNKRVLAGIIKQCAQICIKLGLIEGNTLFVDGTKIKANASKKRTFTKEQAENLLKNIDVRIDQILNECEKIDKQETNEKSYVKLEEELKDKQNLKNKIEEAIKELKRSEKKSINITDKESVLVKNGQNFYAGYNGQMVVDDKNGLIVQSDVVAESNDMNQFSRQIEKAEENIGKKCKNACADTGYSNTDELKKTFDKGIRVIVPYKTEAHAKRLGKFAKEKFEYDEKNNCYICPDGKILKYKYLDKTNKFLIYETENIETCLECKNFKQCTKSGKRRNIRRLENENVKKELEKIYKSEKSQEIYRRRKMKVEHPFGHIKRNLGINTFLCRGLETVKAEMSIFTSCFNIRRMITLLSGVENLVIKLSS